MKRMHYCLVAVGVAALIVGVLAWPRARKQSLKPPSAVEQPIASVATQATAAATQPAAPAFSPDSRPAVQRLYEAAQALRLYNFNPEITGYREDTTPRGEAYVMVGTPSHVAQLINGKLIKVASLYDGSDTRRKPEAAHEWYTATGTWRKEEAVAETMNILRKLGATNSLDSILSGTHDYQATPLDVKTPEGEHKRVVAFPTVRMYDTNKNLRVLAEYRMGPTGVVGVTEWFSP